jgi:hypothetical protein
MATNSKLKTEKSRQQTSKSNPGNPPGAAFKAGSAPKIEAVDMKAKTTERFKSEPNYNWQDAKRRGSNDVPREMVAKRKEFEKQYKEGKFENKKQFKDSVSTTYSPSASKRESRGGGGPNFDGAKRAVKNTATKIKKACSPGVGKRGAGVNLCKSNSAF